MDELPDLTSDADVDALMTRLRARLEPPPAPPARDAAGGEFAVAFDNLVAAHEGLAASMVRAMEVIVDTIEEFAVEQHPAPAAAPAVAPTRKLSPRVRPVTRRAPRQASRRRAKR
jgi:hypothetical protein